jgi:3',5'-cyclic-AMP phosphodiesterase
MTDIHIQPELNAAEGTLKAIKEINGIAPDFVVTGGDNIMDALRQNHERADTLFNLLKATMSGIEYPLYYTIGNHDVFGLYKESGVDISNKDFGKKLYEDKIAKRYYSKDIKDWHFIFLDAIGMNLNTRRYYGFIDDEQIAWLKKDLENTGTETPIAVSVHIPLRTIYNQVYESPIKATDSADIIVNANEVMKVFSDYNLKLVLQGHMHFIEDIFYKNVHFITGGAVSANWWNGPLDGMEEGFMLFEIEGDNITWKYIDFGWNAK